METVFITGASSGFGLAIARRFAMRGARVILAARRFEKLQALASELNEEFCNENYPVALDVRDRKSVERAVTSLPEEFRRITHLINNAGLAAGRDSVASVNLDDVDLMVDTNLKGLLYVTRKILPGMVERGAGHIVNIGSIAGHDPYGGGATYCATKAGVRMITTALREELLGTGIRVTSVDPGLAETEFSVVRFKGDTARAKGVYQGLEPLSADDIAEAVIWSISQPEHVNVQEILLAATAQVGSKLVHRKES